MKNAIKTFIEKIDSRINKEYIPPIVLCEMVTIMSVISLNIINVITDVKNEDLIMIILVSFFQLIAVILPNLKAAKDTTLRRIKEKEKLTVSQALKEEFARLLWVAIMITVNLALGAVLLELGKQFGLTDLQNENQQLANSFTSSFPIVMLIYGGIIGPAAEEIEYRYLIKNLFKNKWIGRILGTVLFACAHIATLNDPKELLSLPIYIILGAILLYISEKNNSLEYSISVHRRYNIVLLAITIMSSLTT